MAEEDYRQKFADLLNNPNYLKEYCVMVGGDLTNVCNKMKNDEGCPCCCTDCPINLFLDKLEICITRCQNSINMHQDNMLKYLNMCSGRQQV